MAYKDPEKARTYQRAYYRKNRARITARWRRYRRSDPKRYNDRVKKWRLFNRSKIQANSKRRAREDRARLNELKAKLGCSRCPERHPATLDFHHKHGTRKVKAVAAMAGMFSWAKIAREIKKCTVLCSNCHRKEHWKGPS